MVEFSKRGAFAAYRGLVFIRTVLEPNDSIIINRHSIVVKRKTVVLYSINASSVYFVILKYYVNNKI
jgi:hypothetical protein